VVEGKPYDVPASENPVQRAVSVDGSERRAVDQPCHEVAVPQRQSSTDVIEAERDLVELLPHLRVALLADHEHDLAHSGRNRTTREAKRRRETEWSA
jgi:hypothetical protein